MKIGSVQGAFLSEEQKQVKQEIMVSLMNVIPKAMIDHGKKFDNQTMMDLVVSVLIMFMRENLVRTVECIQDPNKNPKMIEGFVGAILNIIKEQVMDLTIKRKLQ